MSLHRKLNIGFIGAGQMAYHLARAFSGNGHRIAQIISRNPLSANKLASVFDAKDSDSIGDLDTSLDILFLTIPDDALVEVIQDVSMFQNLMVHTCGTCPLSVLACRRYPHGVFYPLMSFSPGRDIQWNEIPVFIEGSDAESVSLLQDLASELSPRVHEVDSKYRLKIHLTAVWANNFTNHIMARAFELADQFEIPKEWFYPLIRETFDKALMRGPGNSQTGPAVRHDQRTLRKHGEMLNFDPFIKNLYEVITVSIQELHKRGDI